MGILLSSQHLGGRLNKFGNVSEYILLSKLNSPFKFALNSFSNVISIFLFFGLVGEVFIGLFAGF